MTLPSLLPADALGMLPSSLRDELLEAFQKIVNNYRERRWEQAELNGGKLCEIVYSILRGHVDGKFPPSSSKPPRLADACKALEQASGFPRSVRVQLPRMLIALYEIRNNRGVGHVGGEVDPNFMDATAVLAMSKWVLAELVRIFHQLDPAEAEGIVDALTIREVPLVWEVNGRRRVLNPSLTMKEKTLLLLYSSNAPLGETVLGEWAERSNASNYRRDVLRPMHKLKLVEYDPTAGTVALSPIGVRQVEDRLLRAGLTNKPLATTHRRWCNRRPGLMHCSCPLVGLSTGSCQDGLTCRRRSRGWRRLGVGEGGWSPLRHRVEPPRELKPAAGRGCRLLGVRVGGRPRHPSLMSRRLGGEPWQLPTPMRSPRASCRSSG
jgi:hypothetical protein